MQFLIIMNYRLRYLLSFILLLLPLSLHAQMFSVEESEQRVRPSGNALTVGLDFVDMQPRPDDQDIVYEWSDPVYRIRFEMPGIEAYAGYRTNVGNGGTGADTLSYMNLGITISGGMPLLGDRNFGIAIPVLLSSDMVRVRSTSSQPEGEQFRQSSVSIGLGAGGYITLAERFRMRAELIPQFGFTMASLGRDSGQLFTLDGKVRFNIDRVINRYGFVVGYNYQFKRYSGGSEHYHYDLNSNAFVIGINF